MDAQLRKQMTIEINRQLEAMSDNGVDTVSLSQLVGDMSLHLMQALVACQNVPVPHSLLNGYGTCISGIEARLERLEARIAARQKPIKKRQQSKRKRQ